MTDYLVVNSLRWCLCFFALFISPLTFSAEVEISITATPRISTASVGESTETVVQWHVIAPESADTSFPFEVLSSAASIVISPQSGDTVAGRTISSTLSFSCDDASRHIFAITIRVAEIEHRLPWSVTCTGPKVTVVPPNSTVAVLNQVAQSRLAMWFIAVGTDIEKLPYTINSPTTDLHSSKSSGEVEPDERVVSNLEYTCSELGSNTLDIQATLGSQEHLISWEVICVEPKYHVEIKSWPEEVYVQEAGEYVRGELSWEAAPVDDSSESVPFIVSAGTTGLRITNAAGMVSANQVIRNRFGFACRSRGRHTLRLRIEVAHSVRDIAWQVHCLGEDLQALTASFYQGPLIARVQLKYEEEVWHTRAVHETHYLGQELWLDSKRRTFLTIVAKHVNRFPLPISVRWLDQDGKATPMTLVETTTEPINNAQQRASYESRFTFDLDRATLEEVTAFRILVDPEDEIPEVNEGNNDVLLDPSILNSRSSQVVQIQFVPLITADGEVDLSELGPYLNPITDLMPVGEMVVSVREPFDISHLTWSAETASDVLGELYELWISEGSRIEFFHGIVPVPSGTSREDTVCGLATLSGNTAVSMSENEFCSKQTTAHEFGHNLSLYHAPACGADVVQLDEDYPYSDGSIGIETGWLMSLGRFIGPHVSNEFRYADIMSFCIESFTSQYSYGKALNYRQTNLTQSNEDLVLASRSQPHSYDQRSWVIIGDVSDRGYWSVAKVKQVNQAPRVMNLDTKSGYELRVLDTASGELLYSESISPLAEAHEILGGRMWGARVPVYDGVDPYFLVVDDRRRVLVEAVLQDSKRLEFQ